MPGDADLERSGLEEAEAALLKAELLLSKAKGIQRRSWHDALVSLLRGLGKSDEGGVLESKLGPRWDVKEEG